MKTVGWAWEQALPPGPKLLLAALADSSGQSGDCRTTITRIVAKTGLSPGEICGLLADLNDRGLLDYVETSGGDSIHLKLNGPDETPVPGATKRPPDTSPGALYVLSTSIGLTKVGISRDLAARMESIEKSAFVPVTLAYSFNCSINVARQFERRILDHFAADRVQGEWLRLDVADVVAFARSITEAG